MSVPPSARVLVCKGSREEAIVVSKGTPGDMSNRVVFSEHRATEESRVVGVKKDGPKRGRCGARLATHHRMRASAVIEIHRGDFARAVINALCVNARSCLMTDSDPPGPERVDVVGPVGPLFDGRVNAQCRIGVCVGGAKVRGRERYRHCGSVGSGLLASTCWRSADDRVPYGGHVAPREYSRRDAANGACAQPEDHIKIT